MVNALHMAVPFGLLPARGPCGAAFFRCFPLTLDTAGGARGVGMLRTLGIFLQGWCLLVLRLGLLGLLTGLLPCYGKLFRCYIKGAAIVGDVTGEEGELGRRGAAKNSGSLMEQLLEGLSAVLKGVLVCLEFVQDFLSF